MIDKIITERTCNLILYYEMYSIESVYTFDFRPVRTLLLQYHLEIKHLSSETTAQPHHKKLNQRRQQKLLRPAFWFIPNESKSTSEAVSFHQIQLTVIAHRRGSVLPSPHYHLLLPNMDFPELYWASGQQSCQHTQCKTLPNQFCKEPTGSALTREWRRYSKAFIVCCGKSLFYPVIVKMDSQACDFCGMLDVQTQILNTTRNVFEVIQLHNVY